MGVATPRIAVLSATESKLEAMPSSIEAGEIAGAAAAAAGVPARICHSKCRSAFLNGDSKPRSPRAAERALGAVSYGVLQLAYRVGLGSLAARAADPQFEQGFHN